MRAENLAKLWLKFDKQRSRAHLVLKTLGMGFEKVNGPISGPKPTKENPNFALGGQGQSDAQRLAGEDEGEICVVFCVSGEDRFGPTKL